MKVTQGCHTGNDRPSGLRHSLTCRRPFFLFYGVQHQKRKALQQCSRLDILVTFSCLFFLYSVTNLALTLVERVTKPREGQRELQAPGHDQESVHGYLVSWDWSLFLQGPRHGSGGKQGLWTYRIRKWVDSHAISSGIIHNFIAIQLSVASKTHRRN